MDDDKILQFMRTNGPTLPHQLAKFIDSNILLSSARLSELASRRLVLISNLKIGGSPLYYIPGQEEKLFDFCQYLNAKDQGTVDRLKKHKIFRESQLDLFTKVSLRNVKDFAKPLKVTINGTTELFWKWYLLPDEEVNPLITQLISSNLSELQQTVFPKEEVKPEVVPKTELQDAPEVVPGHVEKEIIKKEVTREKPKSRVAEALKSLKKLKPKRKVEDELFLLAEDFFTKKNIIIESKETIRKNAEINFIVRVPSDIGPITYFCKVKDKKRCDDKDLSSVYMEGQVKKLPTILVYTNDLHKKAEEILDSGMFTNLRALKLK